MSDQGLQGLEAIVRNVATAGKTLRLYPATSPIPRQAVEAAASALKAYFDESPVLSLSLAREGFSFAGQPVGTTTAGVSDLADTLREHGVAEIDITPGCSAEELLAFLALVMRPAEEIRAEGGLSALIAASGVESIRVTDVHLTVIETAQLTSDEDIDAFLRQLANDPEKLSAWLAAASAGDPATFKEGLEELARVVGSGEMDTLLASLASAFKDQTAEGKDALIGLAIERGTVRDMTGGMFRFLGSGEIAGALTDGLYGKNMLSLSTALTSLPLADRIAQVKAEVQAMLPGAGHTGKEIDFLEHMLEVRGRTAPETPLVEADPTYRAVAAEAAQVTDDQIATARANVTASDGALNAASVSTMLTLLDQQADYELYVTGADILAGMVARLLESGDLTLASRVLRELSARESRAVQPWPELTGRLRVSIATAVGPRSMAALVAAVTADRSLLPEAREIIRVAGEAAGPALVAEGIAHKAEGIAVAEELLGRRVVDLLAAAAPQAQWFQLAPIVERLSREGDPRSVQTIETLMRRADEQSRREVATGLAASAGQASARLLGAVLRDASAEDAIVGARALAKSSVSGAASVLGARLDELDLDGKDFLLGREIIGALARVADPSASDVLKRLAGRKALIKRGHFAEVQDLARQALDLRQKRGGA